MDTESGSRKSVSYNWEIERLVGSKKGDYYFRLKSLFRSEYPPLHRERLFNYAETKNLGKSGLNNKEQA